MTQAKSAQDTTTNCIISKDSIASTHRWTLHGKHLPAHFNWKVEFDDFNKTITIYCFEAISHQDDFLLHAAWAEKLSEGKFSDEVLVFRMLDLKNEAYHTRNFYGLAVFGNEIVFDYGDNSMAKRKIKLKYEYSTAKSSSQ